MEEELEQYKRAEKLMKARLTGAAPPVAPMSFLTPDSLSSPAEPSLLENVVTTVSLSLARLLPMVECLCECLADMQVSKMHTEGFQKGCH